MVSLPRICKYCSNRMMHYSPCTCKPAVIDQINFEIKTLKTRIEKLKIRKQNLNKGNLNE